MGGIEKKGMRLAGGAMQRNSHWSRRRHFVHTDESILTVGFEIVFRTYRTSFFANGVGTRMEAERIGITVPFSRTYMACILAS